MNWSLFYITILCSYLAISISGCSSSGKKEEKDLPPKAITLPQIPTMIVGKEDKTNYLIQHYWDSMDFTDTTYIHYPDITEQDIVNYIDLLNNGNDENLIKNSVDKLFAKICDNTEEKTVRHYTDMLAKYLQEPNSPLRNETIYVMIAHNITKSNHPAFNGADKERARFYIEMANKNKKGTIATNFSFTLLSGKEETLHNFTSPYTMLFFYDPECTNCKEYENLINTNSVITTWIREEKMTLLAICTEDKFEEWKQDASTLPETWMVAYDTEQKLNSGRLYSIEATPTIYLLDKDKRVVLKDVALDKLFIWLQNNQY